LAADPARWTNQVRAAALDVAGGSVWVEKVRFHTEPVRAHDESAVGDGPLGELLDYIQLLRRDPDQLDKFGGELDELLRKLPDELKRGSDPAAWTRPGGLGDLLDEIEPLLVGRLLAEGDPS
jgi:hypothetical protein